MVSSSACGPRAAGPSSAAVAARAGSASPPDGDRRDRRFPSSARLTSRRQYQEVYRRGIRVRRPSLTLFGLPNDVGRCRLGITATRKCGGAVIRNRIKRVLRDIFRHQPERHDRSVDIVVNARPGADFGDHARIEREFVDAFRGLLRKVRP